VKRRDVRTALASAFTLAANKSAFGFLSKRQTICRVSLPHSSEPLFLAQRPYSILDAAPCKSSARGNDEPGFATRVFTRSRMIFGDTFPAKRSSELIGNGRAILRKKDGFSSGKSISRTVV